MENSFYSHVSSSKQSVSTMEMRALESFESTPAKTERGKTKLGDADSNCVGTEVGLSSSKKNKIEYDDQSKQLLSERKNRLNLPLVVVSSHRKMMKLANN